MALPLIPIALAIAQAAAPALVPKLVKGLSGDDKAAEVAQQVVDAAMLATRAASPEAARDAVLMDTQAAKEVRLALIELERDFYQADAEDRANARQQTVELAKAGSSIAWGAPVISAVVVVGFFTVMWLLFLAPQSEMSERTFNLLNMLFGALVIGFGQVCNFWLGSSSSSRSKDNLIATMTGPRGS